MTSQVTINWPAQHTTIHSDACCLRSVCLSVCFNRSLAVSEIDTFILLLCFNGRLPKFHFVLMLLLRVHNEDIHNFVWVTYMSTMPSIHVAIPTLDMIISLSQSPPHTLFSRYISSFCSYSVHSSPSLPLPFFNSTLVDWLSVALHVGVSMIQTYAMSRLLGLDKLPGVIFLRLNRHDTDGLGWPVTTHSNRASLPML